MSHALIAVTKGIGTIKVCCVRARNHPGVLVIGLAYSKDISLIVGDSEVELTILKESATQKPTKLSQNQHAIISRYRKE
jgi:hypothetical protein